MALLLSMILKKYHPPPPPPKKKEKKKENIPKWVVRVGHATEKRCLYRELITWGGGGGGSLVIFEWGCAAGTLAPLVYTRACSREFCYPSTRLNSPNPHPLPILE